jgi:hypothetical protein
MAWEYSGAYATDIAASLGDYDNHASGELTGDVCSVQGERYLVRSGHLVPYFEPEHDGEVHRARERLNLELCDRVFRISDARDVGRAPEKADEAIAELISRYQQSTDLNRRGVGRVLFGRIVSRIRDLSRVYLEMRRSHTQDDLNTHEKQILDNIQKLYTFVIVKHPEIFACVRLYDLSIDQDGIIEEVFSEIGKTQQVPMETIYHNRVIKIGEAMKGITQTCQIMTGTLALFDLPQITTITAIIEHYAAQARKISGIPSTDHLSYDWVAGDFINAFDAAKDIIQTIETQHLVKAQSHVFSLWLSTGVNLIHSMQNLRDARKNTIADYQEHALRWHVKHTKKAAG